MPQRDSASGTSVWLGQESSAFGDGDLWVGQHSGDKDILVLDPSTTDTSADVLALYSLTHHRTRSFPRATVLQKIEPLTDEVAKARAKKAYAQRDSHRAEHEEVLAKATNERKDRQRETIIAAHRNFIDAIGLTYQGVRDTAGERRSARVLKCHACGIPLDDFVGAACSICSGVLCSCGACSCGKAVRSS